MSMYEYDNKGVIYVFECEVYLVYIVFMLLKRSLNRSNKKLGWKK